MFFSENKYLIEDNFKNNWAITSDSKLIDGKLCLKATQFLTDNKKYRENVIAWFCPELPYNIGPNGFGGLPGLILELHVMNNVFGLKSLKQITTNELNFFLDTKKSISKIEYDTMLEELQSEMKDGYERILKQQSKK